MPFRSLVIGLVCVVALSAAAPYSIWILGSSEITWSYFPTAAFVAMVLLSLWMARRHLASVVRPFFIGLVVGFFLGMGFSFVVDWIWFPGQGHPILHG